MNELIFLLHTLSIVGFTLGALYLGKEALISVIALQAVIGNIFVLKQIDLLGLHITSADMFTVGCILGLNLLNEYYGKAVAVKASWISFAAMFFFGIMSQVHLLYTPNIFDTSNIHFISLLSPAPRILVASFIAYFISARFDVWFYNKLKQSLNSSIAVRSGISLAVTQLIDTALFSFLGLYGVVASVLTILLVSYVVKLIVISITVPFNQLSKKLFHEQV